MVRFDCPPLGENAMLSGLRHPQSFFKKCVNVCRRFKDFTGVGQAESDYWKQRQARARIAQEIEENARCLGNFQGK